MTSTTTLWVGHEEVGNIFQLLGYKEDSISLAIAWSLTNSRRFCEQFLERTVGKGASPNACSIRIHRYELDGGITDIEVYEPNKFHLVIEAKRGWILPDLSQLKKYAGRQTFSQQKAKIRRLITLSECSNEYAAAHLPAAIVDSIPVLHISWKDLVGWAQSAIRGATHSEKRLLNELIDYFEIVMTSQKKDSNWVYVVSLGGGTPEGWKTSWIDVVQKYSRFRSELIDYFEIVMTSQKKDSNWVYVVSLGGGTPEGWKTSWIDVVQKYSRY